MSQVVNTPPRPGSSSGPPLSFSHSPPNASPYHYVHGTRRARKGRRSSRSSANHSRRPSVKRGSHSRSTKHVPRSTPCPEDDDAFSFNPKHLDAWNMPDELWKQLPGDIQKPLAAVQHAGAALLTSLDRLEVTREELEDNMTGALGSTLLPPAPAPTKESSRHSPGTGSVAVEDSLDVDSSEVMSPLALPAKTDETRQNRNDSLVSRNTTDSDIGETVRLHTRLSELKLAELDEENKKSTPSPVSPTPPFTREISPSGPPSIPLTPLSTAASSISHHSYSPMPTATAPWDPNHPPDSPLEARYCTELFYLRWDALVRLTHAARKTNTDWKEVKRVERLDADTVERFEEWWKCKREEIDGVKTKIMNMGDW